MEISGEGVVDVVVVKTIERGGLVRECFFFVGWVPKRRTRSEKVGWNIEEERGERKKL